MLKLRVRAAYAAIRPAPMTASFTALVAAAILIAMPVPAAAEAGPGDTPVATSAGAAPGDVVDRFDAGLLTVMQGADKLGYEGRYNILAPLIRSTFNVPLMTRIVVGASGWSGWSDQQRATIADAFEKFIISTYARRFDGYSGESFVNDGSEQRALGTLVKTHLARPDDTPVTINYLLRSNAGNWQVVDVYLTGTISELATEQSEFSAVMDRDGYQGLLDALTAKTGPSPPP
jgi:phospholipid transport system substrate-binding protein